MKEPLSDARRAQGPGISASPAAAGVSVVTSTHVMQPPTAVFSFPRLCNAPLTRLLRTTHILKPRGTSRYPSVIVCVLYVSKFVS
jgi:hypothetical protein